MPVVRHRGKEPGSLMAVLRCGEMRGEGAVQALLPTGRSGAQRTTTTRSDSTLRDDIFCRTIALWVTGSALWPIFARRKKTGSGQTDFDTAPPVSRKSSWVEAKKQPRSGGVFGNGHTGVRAARRQLSRRQLSCGAGGGQVDQREEGGRRGHCQTS